MKKSLFNDVDEVGQREREIISRVIIMNRHVIIKSHYQFDKLRKSGGIVENYDEKGKKLCR